MSRKRDTNWSRAEITVLLDSITEITKLRASENKKTNSREVFEYAAKKLGEGGHTCRAEREKCRTKWKKMKEEFSYAKKAREGVHRFKEPPGILPFYSRMDEIINGSFENISPHSTIVRRASTSSNQRLSGQRTSARIAANTNGLVSTDNSGSTTMPSTTTTTLPTGYHQQAIPNGDLCTAIYTTTYNNNSNSNNTNPNPNPNNNHTSNTSSTNMLSTSSNNDTIQLQSPTEHADISYRVSTGCRQITIFGDHDVDIKFRGDCVTINKIDVDYPA